MCMNVHFPGRVHEKVNDPGVDMYDQSHAELTANVKQEQTPTGWTLVGQNRTLWPPLSGQRVG